MNASSAVGHDTNPSLLELMVNARFSALLMCIEIGLSGLDSDEVDSHRGDAWEAAELAGYIYPDMPLPSMLGEETELGHAWRYGQARHECEVREARKEIIEQKKAQQVEAVLRGAAGWDSIGMPSPDVAIKTLLDGDHLWVNGHSVWYENGATWFTNGYGQEGVLGNAPEMSMMLSFLADMARGKEYGPVPY